jgi:hypothetical protein
LTNFKDYDALTQEREAFVRRIGGKDIEFRKVLPAKLVLDIRRRANKEMSDEEAENFGFALIEEIIGKEQYEHISSHLGVDHLSELVADVLTYYGLTDDSEDEEGKDGTPVAEEPQSPSSESSAASEHSTPTSKDTTRTPDEDSTTTPSTGTPSSAVSEIYPLAHSS